MNSIIFPTIVLIMVATMGATSVEAQTYQDIHLTVNGVEQVVGTANPELSTIPQGEVYATIHLDQPETISCTLQQCVSQIDTDTTFGGWQAKIKGTMQNQTAEIQLVNSHGVVTYTMVLMPEEKQAVTQNTQKTSVSIPYINSVPEWWIGVGVVLLVVMLVLAARHLRNRRHVVWH